MRVPKPILLAAALAGILFLAAGCAGEAIAQGDCLAPQDGRLVAVPCATEGSVPSDTTPGPTAPVVTQDTSPTSDTDGADGLTAGLGVQTFMREGTCFICHTIDSLPAARGTTGPNLSQVGLKGGEFIRQSIVEPNAVIADGFVANVMTQTFAQILTQEQVDALVEYLSTLQ
jgi:mono/diheme cytochrome c family protein